MEIHVKIGDETYACETSSACHNLSGNAGIMKMHQRFEELRLKYNLAMFTELTALAQTLGKVTKVSIY